MGASITLAGESLIAQKQGAQQKLEVAQFVLANVPDLDPNTAVNRAGTLPPANQIVYTSAVTRRGYVSPRQVIYSLMIASDIGDFDFNWIGLKTAEGVLLAVAYVPLQQKRKNIPPTQIGNNITRNFLVEFNGAQQLTGINVDASTWQHDFTVRLTGIDERERRSNRDMYGRACFFQDSLQMERNTFGLFQLKAGTAYIEGVRVALTAAALVQLPALPAKAWLDVYLAHEGSEVLASWSVVFGTTKVDYTDTNGRAHYLVPLAEIAAAGTITDLRVWQPVSSALIEHFAAQFGDYPDLRARATTKEDVDLDQIPNAISDDPDNDRADVLATTRALRLLKEGLTKDDVDLDQIPNAISSDPANNRTDVLATTRALRVLKDGLTKDDVDLDQIPNSISDDPDNNRSDVLASTKALFNLLTRVKNAMGEMVGMIAYFPMATPPAGWLRANGASVSRTAYADLFAKIGTTSGSLSSDTFNLPELRGEFIRGVDDDRGVDVGRAVVSWQDSGNKEHDHPAESSLAGEHDHETEFPRDLVRAHTTEDQDAVLGDQIEQGTVSIKTTKAPDHDHIITVKPSGGAEARPRNVALLACIKY